MGKKCVIGCARRAQLYRRASVKRAGRPAKARVAAGHQYTMRYDMMIVAAAAALAGLKAGSPDIGASRHSAMKNAPRRARASGMLSQIVSTFQLLFLAEAGARHYTLRASYAAGRRRKDAYQRSMRRAPRYLLLRWTHWSRSTGSRRIF